MGSISREIAAESRHRLLRMVPQDGFLFDATVRENVRAGLDGASDRDVETAFEELGLGGWVGALPRGLDTPVGERGEALSVGERQLVALARAHIADPGLSILDEATSAVDPATERRISEALRRLSEGRTTSRWRIDCRRRRGRSRVRVRCRTARRNGHARGARRRRWDVRGIVRELARQRPGALDGRLPRRAPDGRGSRAVPLAGELRVTGLSEPVEVLRDRYGVAYLSAGSLDDLWFAQGFVTAGERLFQMDLALKQANGRLSELFGELTWTTTASRARWASTGRARRSRPGGTRPPAR